MRRKSALLLLSLLALFSLACTLTIPMLPEVEVPRLTVGEMQEYREEVSSAGVASARVKIEQGIGDLSIAPGDPALLFAGVFRTNVAEWAPEVSWQNGRLDIEQGTTTGMPGAGAENEWELAFSPDVELDMELEIGAVDCELDLGGLALTRLSIDSGASDLVLRFDEPNRAEMERLRIQVGAANAEVRSIGNASPQNVRIDGGVGNIALDLTGAWANSSDIRITAGSGMLTLRLPRDVGVRVEMEGGLGDIEADADLHYEDGVYTNDAYGEAAINLLIEVTVGIGSVELELE